MGNLKSWLRIVVILAVFYCGSSSPTEGCEGWPFRRPVLSIAERQVYAKLQEETDFEFTETPLVEVVDYFRKYHEIEIQLDAKVLGDSGIGTDPTITALGREMSLHEALECVLEPLGLTYTVEDRVILITAIETAPVDLRIYDVTSLVNAELTADELAERVRTILGPEPLRRSARRAGDVAGRDVNNREAAEETYLVPARVAGYGKSLIVNESAARHREVVKVLIGIHQTVHGADQVLPRMARTKHVRKRPVEQDASAEDDPFAK